MLYNPLFYKTLHDISLLLLLRLRRKLNAMHVHYSLLSNLRKLQSLCKLRYKRFQKAAIYGKFLQRRRTLRVRSVKRFKSHGWCNFTPFELT